MLNLSRNLLVSRYSNQHSKNFLGTNNPSQWRSFCFYFLILLRLLSHLQFGSQQMKCVAFISCSQTVWKAKAYIWWVFFCRCCCFFALKRLLRGYKITLARAFLNKVAAGKGTLEKQQKLYRKLLHTFYIDYEKCRFVCTLQSAAICRICFCIHVSSQPWPQLFFSCALPVEAKSKFIVLWLWCSSWAVLWIIRSCKATIFILTFPQQGVNVAWNEVRKQGQLIFN